MATPTQVAIAKLAGGHDAKYTLRDPPPTTAIRGKRVLILDDALASGGTLRAAKAFGVAAAAREVEGVALKVIGGYWDARDERHRPKAKELRLPSFTPWGTF